MTLYTDEVRRIVKTRKSPYHPRFIYDVIEYKWGLALRMYRDNFELFSDHERETIVEWMFTQLATISKTGIPCYVEVFKSVPNRRSN